MNTTTVHRNDILPLGVLTGAPRVDATALAEQWRLLTPSQKTEFDQMIKELTKGNNDINPAKRYGRVADARAAKLRMGWTPLTPEEKVEYEKIMAECLN